VIELSGATERDCTLDELLAADEAFLASTVREVQPVAELDHHRFPPDRPVVDQLAADVGARIQAELQAA
jgi:branched-chain amino acid aminotransferase